MAPESYDIDSRSGMVHVQQSSDSSIVPNSNGVYWAGIETGLALYAVNLPITYGVIGRKYSKILRNYLRSHFSSRKSGNSRSSMQRDGKRVWREAAPEDNSTASDIQMTDTNFASTENITQDDVPKDDYNPVMEDTATEVIRG